MFDNALFTWRAPEYAHHEKSALWFVCAGLVALTLVVWGIMTDGWTFSLAIIVFCGTYYLTYREKPKIVDVKISKLGVKIGNHGFAYNQIKHFWIVYDPPFVNKLYLRMNGRFHPDVCVSLEDVDVAELRSVLIEHLHEVKGRHEPFADTLVRLFKL